MLMSMRANNAMAFFLVVGIAMALSFLRIPRSRSGNSFPVLLGLICSESEERAKLFHLLYTKGLVKSSIASPVVPIANSKYLILPGVVVKMLYTGLAVACHPTIRPFILMQPLSPHAETKVFPKRLISRPLKSILVSINPNSV